MKCVTECPSYALVENEQCVSICSEGYKVYKNECIPADKNPINKTALALGIIFGVLVLGGIGVLVFLILKWKKQGY